VAESDGKQSYLNRYEALAIAIPGETFLLGAWWFHVLPGAAELEAKDISLGAAGIFAIASFCVGHVLQTVADFLGHYATKMPIFARLGRASVRIANRLPQHMKQRVPQQLVRLLNVEIKDPANFDWSTVVLDMIVAVRNEKRHEMLETFLTISHLHRGLCLSFIVFSGIALTQGQWLSSLTCIGLSGVMLARAQQFNRQYGWELWRQFLAI